MAKTNSAIVGVKVPELEQKITVLKGIESDLTEALNETMVLTRSDTLSSGPCADMVNAAHDSMRKSATALAELSKNIYTYLDDVKTYYLTGDGALKDVFEK